MPLSSKDLADAHNLPHEWVVAVVRALVKEGYLEVDDE